MKIRLERKTVRVDEEIEIPDFAFDFVINQTSEKTADITYLVPTDDYSKILSQLSELIPHLKGLYR